MAVSMGLLASRRSVWRLLSEKPITGVQTPSSSWVLSVLAVAAIIIMVLVVLSIRIGYGGHRQSWWFPMMMVVDVVILVTFTAVLSWLRAPRWALQSKT